MVGESYIEIKLKRDTYSEINLTGDLRATSYIIIVQGMRDPVMEFTAMV